MIEGNRYISRTGHLSCPPPEVFRFVTDLRNFRQFISSDGIDDNNFGVESCSISFAPVGKIEMGLKEKIEFSKVIYNGKLLGTQEFSMILDISGKNDDRAEVVISVIASMNPFVRMMAENSINRFLGMIIDEMEKFRGWHHQYDRG